MWMAITIFIIVLAAGLMVMAVINTSHFSQLERLAQHRKHMLQLNPYDVRSNIFVKQHAENRFTHLLMLAGLEHQYRSVRWQWISTTIVLTGGLGVAAYSISPNYSIAGAVIGAILGAAGFLYYLKFIAKMHQSKLTRQLPQILESIASSLKAGSSILEMFRTIADVAPEPMRSEFLRARSGFQFNKPVREVLNDMTKRITTLEFKLFVQAVLLSQEAGVDLAYVVAEIANTLRERFKLQDFVSSITAQGKLTAGMLCSLPFASTAFGLVVNPSYMVPFFMNPLCQLVTAVLVCWELVGVYILSKIVAFEV